MKYVALLRGVNVGGNHRVPRQEFRLVLEGIGFSDVVVYLNSGNAVFASSSLPSAQTIQSALEEHFKFPIPTLLLPAGQVQAIANAIPSDWTNDRLIPEKTGRKSDVIYLFESINSPSVIDSIGYKPEIESMKYVDGAVITSVARKNQSQGSLQKLITNREIYNNVTIRNVNTARKLAELTN